MFFALLINLLNKLNNFLSTQCNLKLWYFCSFFAGIVFFFYTKLDTIHIVFCLIIVLVLNFVKKFLPDDAFFIRFILASITYFSLAFIVVQIHSSKKLHVQNTDRASYYHFYKNTTMIGKISDIIEYEKYYLLELENCFFSGQKSNYLLNKVKLKINEDFKPNFDFNIFQKIEIEVIIFPYNGANYSLNSKLNFHSFNVDGMAIARSVPKLIYDPPSQYGFKSLMFDIRNNIDQIFFTYLSKNNAEIASSLVTGRSERINSDILNVLRNTGIAHILAISGLHISIVGLGCFYILRLIFNLLGLWSKFDVKFVASILSLFISFLFLCLSGSKISAIRAFIMFGILIMSNILNKGSSPIRSLFCAAIVMLLLNPSYLLSPSFQLSFISVIFLLQNWNFLKFTSFEFKSRSRVGASLIKYFLDNLSASFLGSCASLVFSIYHFFQFPIYSLLSNFILVPVFVICIMPLIILGLFCEIFSLGGYILYILDFILDVFLSVASFISKLPFAVVKTGYIKEYLLGIFLFGVCWLMIWQGKIRYFAFLFFMITLYGMLFFVRVNYILFPNFTFIENKAKHINVYYLYNPPTSTQILFWQNMLAKESVFLFPFARNDTKILSADEKIQIILGDNANIMVNYDCSADVLLIHIPKNFKLLDSLKIFNRKGVISFNQ